MLQTPVTVTSGRHAYQILLQRGPLSPAALLAHLPELEVSSTQGQLHNLLGSVQNKNPAPLIKKQGKNAIKSTKIWASLVAQRLRIHLPMQGTWVRSLVREDPTCRGATKPVRHNY